MTKKNDEQNCFSLSYDFSLSKNSIWEVLTKSLFTFKRQDGVKDENFNIFGVHWKIQILHGEFMKNQYRGGIPKKGFLERLQI